MKKLLLILIIVLASIVRLWGLSSYPAGLNADEAALGYNAYSIMTTGRDEHGHFLPVNLESFGDFKPALYSYILIPFIKVMGMTELAVRLPSALMGILAVVGMYLLAKRLFDERIATIATAVLAISPWHIHFSRGGWEVNVATTCMVWGVWLFLRWIDSNRLRDAILTITVFVAAMYTYQSARILVPLLGLGLVLFYKSFVLSRTRQIIPATVVGVLLLLPLGISIFTTAAGARLAGVGLFADMGPINRINELRGQHLDPASFAAKIMHNKPLAYTWAFLENYFDHWQGEFLFVNGDVIERNRVPEMGQLYLIEAAFLGLGIVYLIKRHSRSSGVVWWWLVLAPLPAAITFQTPHALRAFTMVIPLTMLIALGISQVATKKYLVGVVIAVYIFAFTRYLHQYYVHYPQTYPAAWEYGFKEVAEFVAENEANYPSIIITDKYDQPYALILFYLRYSPQSFQNDHVLTERDRFNFSTVRDFGKFHFTNTPWAKVSDTHPALIVAAAEDIPEVGVNVVKTINFPNGKPAFKIISN